MGKSTPKAPTPPDPTVVANAQSAANLATAAGQRDLNMINTTGPTGSVKYDVDPHAPGGYSQNTTLSGPEQLSYDLTKSAQNSALGVANDQIGRVGDALATPFNYDGLPALQGSVTPGKAQTSFGQSPSIQQSFAGGGDIQKHMGPTDFTQDRRDVTQSVLDQYTSRLNPQWSDRERALETKLANQGVGANSAAYGNSRDQFSRDRNDAYNQANYTAVQAGANEQNTLFNQALQQGNFANNAQAQQFGQNEAQANFYNQAQNQQFGQDLTRGQFHNAGTAQNLNQDIAAGQFQNTARQQGGQERAFTQDHALNQFNSLMSSGQVGSPQGIQYTPSSVAPTDVLGAYALNTQQQNANYQAAMQSQQSGLGGLFSLGASLLGGPMAGAAAGALFKK